MTLVTRASNHAGLPAAAGVVTISFATCLVAPLPIPKIPDLTAPIPNQRYP